jgi:hypothetical protein
LTDQTVTSIKKMTDVVAKAEADVSAVEAVSAIAQAGAAPESVNELGMRLGKQLAANYKKR